MILFDGVSKRYGTRTIFEDVSLHIKPGEFVSVVGDSGTGKTTLIKLMIGQERPSEGVIFARNRDLREVRGDELQKYRRGIGVVFQDCKLLPHKTVFENIAFPLEVCGYSLANIVPAVEEALGRIKITHLQDQYPHELSGGEAQRVALARAIVHKPHLVLADEPTGNLDFENAKAILKELIKINMGGTTVILTTHNRPLVELANQRIVHLENGTVC